MLILNEADFSRLRAGALRGHLDAEQVRALTRLLDSARPIEDD